ncbi:hypothetical protein UYO_0019 [Lachnospiraceae bacterium JC7]|nr:hypothetical protein UYO_0019 [Lachnospiraceae bacterium JC7]
MNENETIKEKTDVNKIVDGLDLFDDDLMTLVFTDNIPAVELVLSVILGRQIKVINVVTQEELRNHTLDGRDITLDVHAIDADGAEIDIEVQGNSKGANVRRARFHSAAIDSRMLKEGEPFKALNDSYVIFIYKYDKFKEGLPLYRIERKVLETDKKFNDGSNIIYVNGRYKGKDKIGMLIKDFHAKSSSEMHFSELARGLRHFKETKKGRDIVCEKVQKYARQYALDSKIQDIKNLMNNANWTIEQTLNAMGIKGKDREYILNVIQAESGEPVEAQLT